ncbi:type III secretion system export apparatus subunit SctR [Citrobacter freundii]|nr:type III secretion system export apparatus subunit SctR [Citrobacter freundii]
MSELINQPYLLICFLALLSLLPLMVVCCTSFLKLAVVFNILRTALGIQQIPPNMAIYGLSLILTLFIMAPVGFKISSNLTEMPVDLSQPEWYDQLNPTVIEPYLQFLQKNTRPKQIAYFSGVGKKVWPAEDQFRLNRNSLLVMIPAFCLSQLEDAFRIGLLIYLPFMAIDLIVSNILLALGMMMVSPTTISLPFKLMLFIVAGGWQYLIEKLLMSF